MPATAHSRYYRLLLLMFGHYRLLLMPQGVGLLTCGAALLSMMQEQPVDDEDPEPNPYPPAGAACGASPPERKRQKIACPRCGTFLSQFPKMHFSVAGKLACPAYLGLFPLALARRRRRAFFGRT